MEIVKLPIHKHNLLPIARFSSGPCHGCWRGGYLYGGYRCNEPGCDAVFHKDCAESLQEVNHPSHPDHPLKLLLDVKSSPCNLCGVQFTSGYFCSECDFKLDIGCVRSTTPLLSIVNSNANDYPLALSPAVGVMLQLRPPLCKGCGLVIHSLEQYYTSQQCNLFFHVECTEYFPQAYHASHTQHPLKFLKNEAPDYADKKCLLCGMVFKKKLHHCHTCNFSICGGCVRNPPPLGVVSSTTHEHQLHLVPRLLDFTCNACGTQGDRSPYFCLPCNFMIHRECIDLPRVININRHDHRISYTRRLGHGSWTCGVCRKKMDGFYGGYSCLRCPSYAVHSKCATRKDVWDKVELEGTFEEEEIPPFEVIDENTIKHFGHDHYLIFNKDGEILQENRRCQACVFDICRESFYNCHQCDFIMHERCANLPRKKRHMCHDQPFMLQTGSRHKSSMCALCQQHFSGFRYKSGIRKFLDVRCGSVSEPLVHESHPHPLYYAANNGSCSRCGMTHIQKGQFSCDECDFGIDFGCALLPKRVMKHRYDDHPLVLSYGDKNVDGEYWCEACETRVNPSKGFYACNDCGITLHVSCVVGDFSYMMPGTCPRSGEEVVPNTSVSRPLCYVCNSRCKLPYILKVSMAGDVVYICSTKCRIGIRHKRSR